MLERLFEQRAATSGSPNASVRLRSKRSLGAKVAELTQILDEDGYFASWEELDPVAAGAPDGLPDRREQLRDLGGRRAIRPGLHQRDRLHPGRARRGRVRRAGPSHGFGRLVLRLRDPPGRRLMTGLDRDLRRLVEIVPHLRGSTVAAGDGWTSGHSPSSATTRPTRWTCSWPRTGPADSPWTDLPTPRRSTRGTPSASSAPPSGCGCSVEICPTRRRSTRRSGWRSTFLPRIAFTGVTSYDARRVRGRRPDRPPRSVGRTHHRPRADRPDAAVARTSPRRCRRADWPSLRAAGSGGLPDPGRTVEAFRAALPEHIAGLGNWVPGPNWMRGACCLWFREDPSGAMCTLCPITDRTEPT